MIVTSFYPVFYTDDIEGEIKKFTEDLGFQLKHRPPIEFLDYAVLENANGNKLDLVCSRFPADNFQNGFLVCAQTLTTLMKAYRILNRKAILCSVNPMRRLHP